MQKISKVYLVHGIGEGMIKAVLLGELDRNFGRFVRDIETSARNRGETLLHLR